MKTNMQFYRFTITAETDNWDDPATVTNTDTHRSWAFTRISDAHTAVMDALNGGHLDVKSSGWTRLEAI
jgi:hypothetical protein